MVESEKVIEFLASPEFYNDWFLVTVKAFDIKSTENFLKFAAILQFLDGWVRENLSNDEAYNKAKEIMTPTDFTDEEIGKILDFINQNFSFKRDELWQTSLEVSNVDQDDFAEKEKRYTELMETLIKKPVTDSEVSSLERNLKTPLAEDKSISEPEKVLTFNEAKEETQILSENEEETATTKVDTSPETDITPINFKPLTQIDEKTIKNLDLDNITIKKKKETPEDQDKFLDLSNL